MYPLNSLNYYPNNPLSLYNLGQSPLLGVGTSMPNLFATPDLSAYTQLQMSPYNAYGMGNFNNFNSYPPQTNSAEDNEMQTLALNGASQDLTEMMQGMTDSVRGIIQDQGLDVAYVAPKDTTTQDVFSAMQTIGNVSSNVFKTVTSYTDMKAAPERAARNRADTEAIARQVVSQQNAASAAARH